MLWSISVCQLFWGEGDFQRSIHIHFYKARSLIPFFLHILFGPMISGLPQERSEVTQSCPTLWDPMDCSPYQAPLSIGFSRQDCWSGLSFPSPGDLPDRGTEPRSPALQADALPSEPAGKARTAIGGS